MAPTERDYPPTPWEATISLTAAELDNLEDTLRYGAFGAEPPGPAILAKVEAAQAALAASKSAELELEAD